MKKTTYFVLYILTIPSLSLLNKIYKTSKLPQTDLKVISAQQTNFIKSQWYNKIMEDIEIQQKDSWDNCKDPIAWANNQKITLESNPILKHINTLESYFQSSKKESLLYLAWMPQEINTKISKDILSLIICDSDDYNIYLKCIIPNPSWSSENIDSGELKKCLYSLETKEQILNVTQFFNNPANIRYKLDWSLF
tara:strand:+ start:714 stop:1295 length:582 start_codon:yes stop_codon:yes gene_type:complete